MEDINFWKLNARKVVMNYLLVLLVCLCMAILFNASNTLYFFCILAFFGTLAYFLVGVLSSVRCFTIIKNLSSNTSKVSILPLFDNGYTIELTNKKKWLLFSNPCIHATISGLPVVINFTQGTQYNPSKINFQFEPLISEGSHAVSNTCISFKMRWLNELKNDIKPQVMQFVQDAKTKGGTHQVTLDPCH